MPRRNVWVVKLGGSLALAPELRAWLDTINRAASRHAMVIVPGGGPYADLVRETQRFWGFDEVAAHRLAIGAMEAYARLLHVLEPSLVPAREVDQIEHVTSAGRPALWLPTDACLGAPELPQTWDVSSDSLALWLAARTHASHLTLIKSARPATHARDVASLVEAGFIDAYFPLLLAHVPCRVAWYAKDEQAQFDAALDEPAGGTAGGAERYIIRARL